MIWHEDDLSPDTYEVGEFVKYGGRLAIVLENLIIENEMGRKMAKLYFLDSDKSAILDLILLSKLKDEELGPAYELFENLCDCGEKHVSGDKSHSNWCKTLTYDKRDKNENNLELPKSNSGKASWFF